LFIVFQRQNAAFIYFVKINKWISLAKRKMFGD